jgi:ribonuclease P protein component
VAVSASLLPHLARVTIARRLLLGPQARLRRTAEISRLRDVGEKLYSKHFLVVVAPSLQTESRIAIAVTTKIEKRATGRNRIKRRIREIFRQNRHSLTQPLDILVVARRDVQLCEFSDYRRQILGALKNRGYLATTSA